MQNGKFSAEAWLLVSTLKKVDFPTFGNPTIPIFKEVPNLPMIGGGLIPSPPFLGGIVLWAGDDTGSQRQRETSPAGNGRRGGRRRERRASPSAERHARRRRNRRAGRRAAPARRPRAPPRPAPRAHPPRPLARAAGRREQGGRGRARESGRGREPEAELAGPAPGARVCLTRNAWGSQPRSPASLPVRAPRGPHTLSSRAAAPRFTRWTPERLTLPARLGTGHLRAGEQPRQPSSTATES